MEQRAKVAGKTQQAAIAKRGKEAIRKNMSRLKKSQRSLRAWTKQKWSTKSGKKSSETG